MKQVPRFCKPIMPINILSKINRFDEEQKKVKNISIQEHFFKYFPIFRITRDMHFI